VDVVRHPSDRQDIAFHPAAKEFDVAVELGSHLRTKKGKPVPGSPDEVHVDADRALMHVSLQHERRCGAGTSG
jgi:hypothetical protein